MGYILGVLKCPVCSLTCFTYYVSVPIYPLFSCSFLLSGLAFSSFLCAHPVLCCLTIQTCNLKSPFHLYLPADFCVSLWLIVLVFGKSCWHNCNSSSKNLASQFSGCFELLTHLSPSSHKLRACLEEQKSMTS